MSKQNTQFAEYIIQTTNTMEQMALHKKGVRFNKAWIYPSAAPTAVTAQSLLAKGYILTQNSGDIYIGEKGDGPNICPDLLGKTDPPFKIELPPGEDKALEDLLIYGTAGDGVWIKYWHA